MTDAPRVGRLSRRTLIKRTLRGGAYAAPVILSLGVVTPVVAATPAPCTQPVTLGQDAVIYGAAPSATYNIYAQPNGTGPFTLLGTIGTDAVGFGQRVFPVTYDSSQVSFLRLTATVPGADPGTQPAT